MSSKAARTRSEPVTLPRLGLAGTLRWIWTQLTSMSTALMLLLLLAVAAVPGSLVPQRRAGPEIVDQWIEDNPVWGPVLDALQFFDVYNSVWFSAIYLLLFVSLVGCVWPRAIQHAKALRQPPARTPRNLTRLPASGVVVLEEGGPSPEEAVARAQAWLRKRRYRLEHRPEAGGASVGAERGYLREIGNILFHVSLIGVLVFMAYGGMTKYGGQKIIVEGEGFANNLVAYDSFTPGTYFSADDLQPFSLTLDSFDAVFDRESETHYGQPLDYTAVMDVREGSGGELQRQILKVNQPLDIDGVRVYLVGNGYAPVVTIRDGAGDVAFQGPVVTRVFDQNYGSQATIKVPDARPDQLGFVGFFLPSAVEDEEGAAFSADPELLNPELQLNSYYGDLGLDTGRPQNVYVLDTASLTELNSRTNENGGIVLSPGQTYELPEGKGSISFDGVRRYVGLDIHYDPGKWGVGVFAGTALLGLAISLFVRRRRVWVRARTDDDGRTRVEYALLARGEEFGLHEEHVALRAAMEKWWPIVAATETADDAAAVTNPLDASLLARLAATVEQATRAFEAYDYARALNVTEQFFWAFTDDYVELVKDRAYGGHGEAEQASVVTTLATTLDAVTGLGAPLPGQRDGARVEGLGQAQRHGVDGEVAAHEIVLEVVAEGDDRLAGHPVVGVGTVGRHLDRVRSLAGADGAELAPHVPVRVAPVGEDRLGLLRGGGGREVEVTAGASEEGVTDRAADEGQVVTPLRKALTQVGEQRHRRGQVGHGGTQDLRGQVGGHGAQGYVGAVPRPDITAPGRWAGSAGCPSRWP